MDPQTLKLAKSLGYSGSGDLYELRDWLREKHQIHLEVGSIWDDLNNTVESYFFSISAPVNIYYFTTQYQNDGASHAEMLEKGTIQSLSLLKDHKAQDSSCIDDNKLVLAYLKGYADKEENESRLKEFRNSIERYAYQLGSQGNYMEEGLSDDDITRLVRNEVPASNHFRVEQEMEDL